MFLRMGVSNSTRGSQEPRPQVLGEIAFITNQLAKEAPPPAQAPGDGHPHWRE